MVHTIRYCTGRCLSVGMYFCVLQLGTVCNFHANSDVDEISEVDGRGQFDLYQRFHRSENEIHKPTRSFSVKMVNKKYVFNSY